jgi:hypothetical protein
VWQCALPQDDCGEFFELPLEWQREYLPLLNPWFVKEHRARMRELEKALERDKTSSSTGG